MVDVSDDGDVAPKRVGDGRRARSGGGHLSSINGGSRGSRGSRGSGLGSGFLGFLGFQGSRFSRFGFRVRVQRRTSNLNAEPLRTREPSPVNSVNPANRRYRFKSNTTPPYKRQ